VNEDGVLGGTLQLKPAGVRGAFRRAKDRWVVDLELDASPNDPDGDFPLRAVSLTVSDDLGACETNVQHHPDRRGGGKQARSDPGCRSDSYHRSHALESPVVTDLPPRWHAVLAAATRLQELVPDAVLVGGTAAAHHARHRVSFDDDHVVVDLKARFDEVLAALEATDGWVTARVKRPVLILGRLEGVETGVRNLIRLRPLEVEEVRMGDRTLRVPTLSEIARIKAWLCLMRNATRDYLDFAALAEVLGSEEAAAVVSSMDEYYSDQIGPGSRRVAAQVAKQLSEPKPDDLSEIDLESYRELDPKWREWSVVRDACRRVAVRALDRLAEVEP
jgi:hypothetical protein